MSVTGTQVITRIEELFNDVSDGKWSDTVKLQAVNAAIDGAWPHIRAVSVDSSQTIASTTYEYTPSATPEVEYGFALAYATLSGEPKQLLRRVKQRQSGTAFTILLDPQTASDYSGETLWLQYNSRIARISAASESIELPLDYLWRAAALHLLIYKMINAAVANVDPYEKLVVKFERDVDRALLRHQRGHLPHRIPIVADHGGGFEIQPRHA